VASTAPIDAFLGDGLPYNWKIQQTHFESFTPILDFIHPIERLHELSRSLFDDADEAWDQCGKWIELCWHGDVAEVIGLLQAELSGVSHRRLTDNKLPDRVPSQGDQPPRQRVREVLE